MENYYGMLKKLLLLVAFAVYANFSIAQQRAITGQVSDSGDGSPIPGVNVVVKGTTVGTITDFDGKFSVQASSTDLLIFSYMGYSTQEITVGANSNILVSLVPAELGLDEVVVIGYGTVKKDDATGSVVAISSKDFNKGAITSPQDLLVGKSAGVVITSSNGSPGSSSKIRIRGGSSLKASNDPLIIIDGVPMDTRDMGGLANPLSTVNPNDIESFTVLKDASATAIYGSRASNGVIIITTKRGKVGSKFKVTYDGNVSVGKATKFVDVYTGDEFRQMVADHPEYFSTANTDALGVENTDWQKEIYRTAVSTDHNISVTGAYKTLPYRVSLGYTDQNGILKNTDLKRTTLALSLDPSFFKDNLKITINAKGMNADNNYGNTDAIGSAVSMDPTQPVMNGNTRYGGYFTWTKGYGLDSVANGFGSNPVAQVDLRDNKSNSKRFIGNIQADYKLPFVPGLSANVNVALDYTDITGHDNTDTTASWMRRGRWGQVKTYGGEYSNQLIDFYLNYNKDIKSISSNINVTAGYSWNHIRRDENKLDLSIVDASHPLVPALDSLITATESYLVSFFGRLNYTLLDRYLLTFTLREDGSSRFKDDNKWGLFPSAAFAWKISQESFLRDVSYVSDLKLRLGWGITGQQNIVDNDYPALAKYTASRAGYSYQFGDTFYQTLRPDAYDKSIKWESTTTQNIGLDFGFLKDRITGSIDLYKRVTDDLISEIAIPNGSNFKNRLLTNVGSIENKGVEVALNIRPVSNANHELSVGFTLSYNKSEITKLLRIDDPDYLGILTGGGVFGGNIQVHQVGSAPSSFFVNQQVYDVNGNPIEGLYVDLNGEGGTVEGINEKKYVYKKPAPDYLMGLSARYTYKNFDISMSSRLSLGNYVYNQIAAEASYNIRFANAYWANAPKYLEDTKFYARQPYSDYFVKNASFFKMDNLSAGYRFENIFDKINARVSFTVQNVFTVTKYKGIDPEIADGIDNNIYPRPRTFILGISLTY
jgi:iron complex outermembrane receptor protein